MHTSRRTRGVLASFVAGAVVVAGSLFGVSTATAAPPAPASMAALGDSISQALMTCSSLTGCPVNSWSTGSTVSVNSHATRLAVPTAGRFNDSVTGAKSGALLGQAQKAVTQAAKYVTIEIGANDACTKTVATMTPVGTVGQNVPGTFATNVAAALSALAGSAAQPEIFVASIPSLTQLYTVNKSSLSARLTWGVLQICQSMLANPSSAKQADVDRRAAVQARVNAYNGVLQAICSTTPKCRFDNLAVAKTAFLASDISTRDYFHPSLAGQTKLANVTWAASQWVS